AWWEHNWVHLYWSGVVWQTIGAAQGNYSQTLPRRITLESTRSRLHTTMERKPTVGTGTESATSFHGGQQRRQVRGCIRTGDEGAYRRCRGDTEGIDQFLPKTDCGPSGKKAAASDIPSGRFCGERWLDVLRSRPSRTFKTCSVDGR